jgi:hypothetical protein
MAGIGHMAHKATDGLSAEALRLMKQGFADKKTSCAISREIAEATGETVNPRTIGRRALEWRNWWDARRARIDEVRALVEASKAGDLTSSEVIQALAMQALIDDPGSLTSQNPLKVQSQSLRSEEISLKREGLRLKAREVAVNEGRLQMLQERERKAAEIAAELENKATQGKSITVEDMARIREVYGLSG